MHEEQAEEIAEQLADEFGWGWPNPRRLGFVKDVKKHLKKHDYHVVLGIYRLLLKHSPNASPKGSLTNLVFAIYHVFPNAEVYDSVACILRDSEADTFSKLAGLYLQQKKKQAERDSAAANLNVYFSTLTSFGYFMRTKLKMRSVPPIKPSVTSKPTNGSVNAYTDGEAIFLPNVHHTFIAGSKSPGLLNGYYLYYLMAHEQSHLGMGSYDLNLESPEAKELLSRFDEGRIQTGKLRIAAEEERVLEKLKETDEKANLEELKRRTHLMDFLAHFPNPALAKELLNILEDARIEKFFERQLPGLYHIQNVFSSHYEANYGAPWELLSEASNFLNGLLAISTNQDIDFAISPRLENAWKSAKKRIEKFLSIESASVYDSAEAAIDLYDLIEQALDDPYSNSQKDDETLEEAFRLSLRRASQLEKDALADLKESNEQIEPLDESLGAKLYPEFNGTTLIQNAVAVEEARFKFNAPKEKTQAPNFNLPPLSSKSRRTFSSRSRRYHLDGDEIDFDLLPDWFAARQAGVSIPITYSQTRSQVRHETWIVIDASVSMESPRDILGGREAMTRAKEIAQRLVVLSNMQRSATRVFVALDAGRTNVLVQELKHGLPEIESVTAVGVGGFRAGALLRHLNHLHRGSRANRHIYFLTDGAPAYLSVSQKNVQRVTNLRNDMCIHCCIRHKCVNESFRFEIEPRLKGIYRPLAYQYRDLRHAIDHSPTTDTFQLVVINDDILDYRHIFDHFLDGYWCDGTTDESLQNGLIRMSEHQTSSHARRTYESFEQNSMTELAMGKE
ncbi:MAG: VWA domain-containing protein [Planctomycetaceae bacterium]|nr:VWA domain-containing protein [Planctomycetaceae bacterium]